MFWRAYGTFNDMLLWLGGCKEAKFYANVEVALTSALEMYFSSVITFTLAFLQ